MIACYANHSRAGLFSALNAIDPTFVDLGVICPDKLHVLRAKIESLQADKVHRTADTGFAPGLARGTEAAGSKLLADHPDVEHVLYWGAKNFPYEPERHGHIPYSVITDMCYDPNDARIPAMWRPNKFARSYFERQHMVFEAASSIFPLTQWAKDQIVRVYGIDPAKVTPIGAGPHQKVGFVAAPQVQAYFLSIGQDWHRKGMDIVRHATESLATIIPSLKTIIAGIPGAGFHWSFDKDKEAPGFAEIMRMLAERSDPVLAIPHALSNETIVALLANARAFILASRFEPAGSVIIEANQAGTPAIGSDVCGIPEMMGQNGGAIFPSENADALTQLMTQYWNMPAGEYLMARRKAAGSRQTWENAAGVLARSLGIAVPRVAA